MAFLAWQRAASGVMKGSYASRRGVPAASRRRRSRALRSWRRGGAIVETALVLPITLLFLCGILEFGRYIFTLQVLTNACREGCRYAITHVNSVVLGGTTYGNATSNVTTVVSNMSAGVTLGSQQTSVFASDALGNNEGTWTSAQAGGSVCVEITGNYIPTISKILSLPGSLSVTCQSVMRVEGA